MLTGLIRRGCDIITYLDDGVMFSDKPINIKEFETRLQAFTGCSLNESKTEILKENGVWAKDISFLGISYDPIENRWYKKFGNGIEVDWSKDPNTILQNLEISGNKTASIKGMIHDLNNCMSRLWKSYQQEIPTLKGGNFIVPNWFKDQMISKTTFINEWSRNMMCTVSKHLNLRNKFKRSRVGILLMDYRKLNKSNRDQYGIHMGSKLLNEKLLVGEKSIGMLKRARRSSRDERKNSTRRNRISRNGNRKMV
jgi:hypothetical protein